MVATDNASYSDMMFGLVLDAIVLWPTNYIDAAVANSAPRATRSATRTSSGSARSSTAT